MTTHHLVEVASGEGNPSYFDQHSFYRVVQADCGEYYLKLLSGLKEETKDFLIAVDYLKNKESPFTTNQCVIVQNKIQFISYPHEWCPSMLKDAALFHLNFQIALLGEDLYLKDAHPWNLLFENGKFKFVDIFSIISCHEFKKLNYLNTASTGNNGSEHYVNQIMKLMFIPYFFLPLCAYKTANPAFVRQLISNQTLGCSTHHFKLIDCFKGKGQRTKKLLSSFKIAFSIFKLNFLLKKKTYNVYRTLKGISALVNNICYNNFNSDYKHYYNQKGEQSLYQYSEDWNNKQKTIHQILTRYPIQSVLDIACNTGWYSILAAQLGKKVVALDIDTACIEELYKQVKLNQYAILPLVMSFLDLTKAKFSIDTGKPILFDFHQRICCDAVLALGIVHHLVLGMNISFEALFEKLLPLSQNYIIIEFVELDDEKIKNESSFFNAFHQNPSDFEFYNLSNFLHIAKKYHLRYSLFPSHPKTRQIIVFERVKS